MPHWHELLAALRLSGMALQLAEHCILETVDDQRVVLCLQREGVNLQTRLAEEALQQALEQYFGYPLKLIIKVSEFVAETPGLRRTRLEQEQFIQAQQAIEQDPFVQALQERFGAMIIQGSIRAHTAD